MDRTSLLRLLLAALLAMLLIAGAGWTTTQAHNGVVVNGAPLQARHTAALEQTYRTRLVPGRYWYDTMSGLWGLEGGASVGLIAPGLPFGDMDPRASVGRFAGITGVFINGREIHPDELQYLRALYGQVPRTRYWLNAGIAGYEGGPPQFDLVAAAQQSRSNSHLRRGLFGSSGSDGQCSYDMHPNGSSVMTGRC